MDCKGDQGVQLPPPPTPHVVWGRSGKVEPSFDVDATKADSDKKSYRLVKLANGLRVLLVHDPPAAGLNCMQPTKGKGKKGGGSDDNDDVDLEGDAEEDSGDDSGSGEDGEDDEGRDDDDNDDDGDDEDDEEPEGVKKAAAAMAVGVGNLSDPERCQGLAHYLEHMLFMGSTKYPDENEYDSFISKSGGSSNAFTECEYTLYHFDVLPQHLEKALDIFAQFFASPLMKADSSDRELQSIESEFCLSKNSDACRLQELWCHTSKRDHPYSKFCWGNMWSLRHEPQSKGVDVRQELIDFHAKHYRAPAMQLVVLGGQSLDELQDLVVRSFSGVAAGEPSVGSGGDGGGSGGGGAGGGGDATGLPEESAAVAAAGLPFDASALGRAFRIQPVKDSHRLHVTWQLGEQHSLYKTKPSEYIGHLIGHEGEGSVLSLLRHKRWATGVSAGISGSGYNNSSCCATFCVTFYLTKAGVRHWLDIVDVLFCYIGLLRREGPQEWVFQEIRDVANIQYRFQEESEPAEYVELLAEQMLPTTRYEELHILKGPYVMEKWDPELMESILEQMTPASARYDIMSSLFGRAVDAPNTKKDKQAMTPNNGANGKEKRGLKRAAAAGGDEVEGGGDDDDEEGSEEGFEEGSEEGSEDDESEEDSEEGSEGEEEEEEEVDQGQYHALCKKPDHDPLEEPRFGLCFWNDVVPSEILEAWEVSQQKPGGNAARSTLLSSNSSNSSNSSSSQECQNAAATPSNGTTTNGIGTKIAGLRQQQKGRGEQGKDNDGPIPILALPKPNRFIPADFDLKEDNAATAPGDEAAAAADAAGAAEGGREEGGHVLHHKRSPRKLVRESAADAAAAAAGAAGAGGVVKLTMWHLHDRTFRQPRAEIYLKVVTPICNESARSAALCELVVRLVNDSLTEYSYSAYVAELQYGLKATDAGFEIHVYGFDHKAPLLLREVLKRLLGLGPHLQEGPLSVQLEALVREYHNTDMKPGRHVSNVRLQALRKGRWSPGQKQAALTGVDVAQEGSEATGAAGTATAAAAAAAAAVSLGDVKAFLNRLFHRVEMEGLVHGNFSEADAEKVLDDVEKVAEEAAHSRESGRAGVDDANRGEFEYPEEPVVRLDPSQHVLYCCPSKDPTEQNCALEVYWQIGVNNLKQRVLADAIEQVMEEPLYDQLRTKEQLGYSVGCSPRVTCGVLGFCVTAQSSAYGPAHLYARIRAFMKSFRDTIAEMEEAAFSMNMESAAANKLQPDNTLSEEAQRHWPEIYSRRRAFHVNVAEAVEIRGLEKSAVLQTYEEWFSGDVGSKPCLTLAVTGGGKFSAKDEAKEIQAKIQEEVDGSSISSSNGGGDEPTSPRKTCVLIATPPELYCPTGGRDVFPNLFA